MKLIIVESPTKCHTIQRYLGDEYLVKASRGHIRDLATRGKGGLGVDVENGFAPTYVVSKDKVAIVNELKGLAKKATEVILATDPDREGEAIAWHLATVLDLDINTNKRLEFHEITRDSISAAMAAPRIIDTNLVSSQETRRILDRIIGFKLSALINRKIHSKSAGRVQSATLKIIYDREKEIKEFVPEEYWEIDVEALIDKEEKKLQFVNDFNGEKEIKTKEQADAIISSLEEKAKIVRVEHSSKTIESKLPFTTSSLQQEAFARLKLSTARTSSIAQSLYEGVSIGGENVGLITYIRTDSTRLSPTYVARATAYIEEAFGKQYVGHVKKSKNNALAQDAHEAIRPTSNHRTPESIRQYLTPDQYNLYKLIYNRAVSSLMKPKKEDVLTFTLSSGNNTFKVQFSKTAFPGYEILYKYEVEKDDVFPEYKAGDEFSITKKEALQKFTNPPARFNEAKIVKTMEELGIGRPSTYASTIQTLKKRKYITEEKGEIYITEQGAKTAHILNKYFHVIVNAEYTADMEKDLDKIQEGDVSSLDVLNEFYGPFIKMVDDGYEKMYADEQEETGELCPKCGHPLVYKMGKNGRFVACSNYPKCKYVESEKKEVEQPKPVKKCPDCETGYLIRKRGKFGYFLGCTNYPKCNHIEQIKKKKGRN